MSISRTADTITVEGHGPGKMVLTGLPNGRVSDGATTFTREQALEFALALTTLATGITVHRPQGSPNYFIECGDASQRLSMAELADTNSSMSAVWVVFDLLRLLDKPALYAMAGESQESLAREFPYLTDDQAKAISNYFAALAH